MNIQPIIVIALGIFSLYMIWREYKASIEQKKEYILSEDFFDEEWDEKIHKEIEKLNIQYDKVPETPDIDVETLQAPKVVPK